MPEITWTSWIRPRQGLIMLQMQCTSNPLSTGGIGGWGWGSVNNIQLLVEQSHLLLIGRVCWGVKARQGLNSQALFPFFLLQPLLSLFVCTTKSNTITTSGGRLSWRVSWSLFSRLIASALHRQANVTELRKAVRRSYESRQVWRSFEVLVVCILRTEHYPSTRCNSAHEWRGKYFRIRSKVSSERMAATMEESFEAKLIEVVAAADLNINTSSGVTMFTYIYILQNWKFF